MQPIETLDRRKVKPSLIVFLLILVFLGPMVFAYYTYQKADDFELKTTNNGDLLKPVVAIESLAIKDPLTKANIDRIVFAKKWSLIYLVPKNCIQGCHENLYKMRQLHTALGKDMPRLQRIYMFLEPHIDSNVHQFLQETYPEVLQIALDTQHITSLVPNHEHKKYSQVGAFYIVDPQGNVMMYYPGDMTIKNVLADLKRLLKVSKIG